MNKAHERVLLEVNALPDEEQQRIARVIEDEVRKAKREGSRAPAERWARLAERLSEKSPLEGRSEESLRQARSFRYGFVMTEPRDAR